MPIGYYVTGLPAVLASPIDPLPPNVLTVTGKASVTFRDEIRVEAEFVREGGQPLLDTLIELVGASDRAIDMRVAMERSPTVLNHTGRLLMPPRPEVSSVH